MSKSMFIYPGGIATRIEFKGGTIGNGYHGQYSTSDEDMQKAVESHPDFGPIRTSRIYLSDTIGSEGQAVWGEDAKIPIKIVKEKKVKVIDLKPELPKDEDNLDEGNLDEEVKKELPHIPTGFKEVKEALITLHGVSPDEVKNFPQLKKKVKDLNLEYVL